MKKKQQHYINDSIVSMMILIRAAVVCWANKITPARAKKNPLLCKSRDFIVIMEMNVLHNKNAKLQFRAGQFRFAFRTSLKCQIDAKSFKPKG